MLLVRPHRVKHRHHGWRRQIRAHRCCCWWWCCHGGALTTRRPVRLVVLNVCQTATTASTAVAASVPLLLLGLAHLVPFTILRLLRRRRFFTTMIGRLLWRRGRVRRRKRSAALEEPVRPLPVYGVSPVCVLCFFFPACIEWELECLVEITAFATGKSPNYDIMQKTNTCSLRSYHK